ncbi:protein of unknown function (plasmid) [Azospirillum baldaniorum]|uniref:Uncharacterized protein n=1 Tax=Azospirillum baldaniorum TaxID=1064539 RepID=A0A9P1JZF0_9PROT|nr:protein of unknown function [Azospirillum baldaniorum]
MIDGYLNPGDRIVIRLGDRRQGGPGTRVQTFVEAGGSASVSSSIRWAARNTRRCRATA